MCAIRNKMLSIAFFITLIILPIKGQSRNQFDLTSPILITDSYSSESSLFGATVTLVQTGDGESAKNWVFIGDPKGNSTDPTYANTRPPIKEPGVVWRCSLSRSGLADKCEIMNLDPNSGRCTYNSCEDYPQQEYKSDSWVGGTLLSNSELFITCGPRWTRGDSYQPYMNGLCYWFNIKEMYKPWDSSRNDLQIDLSRYNHRLIPLFERSTRNHHQSFPLPNGEGSVYDWGLGEFGMSAHLNKRQELVVGAPGIRLYTGGIIIYQDSQAGSGSQSRKNRGRESRFSYYNMISRESYDAPEHHYNYFGYAVTSGSYFGPTLGTFYAGGSPKAMGYGLMSGEVVVFQIPRHGQVLSPRQVIKGHREGFGSYFGSVLLSVDINGDGFDELLVAAPLSGSGSSVGDQGTVFVYTNNKFFSELQQQTQISGESGFSFGGRFGSAMVSLGDINEDGYTDIAISAPYEDNFKGALYIYHGLKEIPYNWGWAHKISPADFDVSISRSLRGFGSSLSTGQDMDNNGTPDLAIGSFLSKNVIILRTRPVITPIAELTYQHPTTKEVMRSIPHDMTEFGIQSCVSYSGSRVHSSLKLTVNLVIDQNLERFGFKEPGRSNSVPYANYETNVLANTRACRLMNVVQIKRSSDDSRPNTTPISTEQTVEYKGPPSSQNSPFQHYDIYKRGNQAQPSLNIDGKINMDTFCPKCAFPDSIHRTYKIDIASECANPQKCVPKLKIQTKFESNGRRVDSAQIDWSKTYSIVLTMTNDGEPAYSPEITFQWKTSSNFSYPKMQSLTEQFCTKDIGIGSFNCSFADSIKKDKPKVFPLQFTLHDIYAKPGKMNLQLYVTVRAEDDVANAVASLDLLSDASVKVSGSIIQGGIEMTDTFTQTYSVSLDGKSPVENIPLIVNIPTQYSGDTVVQVAKPKNAMCVSKNGDFTKLPEKKKSMTAVDPMKDSTNTDSGNSGVVIASRRRREIKGSQTEYEPEIPIQQNPALAASTNKNTTLFTCSSKNTKCMQVECTLSKVPPGSKNQIIFEMRMVQGVAENLFGGKEKLLIQSKGSVKILEAIQTDHMSEGFSENTILKFRNLEAAGTPLWILIVSGAGGLILLLIIIIVLRWLGFFRRTKKEDLERKKAEAEVADNMNAANNVPNFESVDDDQRLQ